MARRLGMSLKQCKADIDSRELAQWIAFDRIDPFTIDRTELIIARFMALISNMMQKNGKATGADFLQFTDKPAKSDNLAKAERLFRGLFNGANQPAKRKS